MEEKKFGLLNIQKKQNVTHADIQKKTQTKKGGRPRKSNSEKLNCIVSLNVNIDEKKTLEEQAKNRGVTVLTLIRVSLTRALKDNFERNSTHQKSDSNQTIQNRSIRKKVIKQYAIPVTKEIKNKLEDWSLELMMSVSDLLKMALKNNEYNNI